MNLVDYELSSDDECDEASRENEKNYCDSSKEGNKSIESQKIECNKSKNSINNRVHHSGSNKTDNGCTTETFKGSQMLKWDSEKENASVVVKTSDLNKMPKNDIEEREKHKYERPNLGKNNLEDQRKKGKLKEAPFANKSKDVESVLHQENDNEGVYKKELNSEGNREDRKNMKDRNIHTSGILADEYTDNRTTRRVNILESNNIMNVNVNEDNFDEIFFLPENEYSDCVNEKIEELSKLYEINLTINKNIINSNEYKNPCILEKIMEIFHIDVYSSNYPLHIYNPNDFLSIDLFNERTEETDQKKTKWS
ncbi:hypothetical protein, conserved [Plasmodium gonderi]|uniref:HCNGP-like protein n=1 Tax=Plasmodium gonderi TaxID=77519 RepID=A0A1Y1JNB6_PLAGO|nr:hypothetical protein, conserved [Plasmodium gonderi]GAW81544.1 hypothetical protein, conserved [Plasmodium gonderi]